MKKVIGKVVLNKNMIGWTDKVNRIVLTFKNPEAFVYEGYNMTLINQACREGRITFIRYDE